MTRKNYNEKSRSFPVVKIKNNNFGFINKLLMKNEKLPKWRWKGKRSSGRKRKDWSSE
jgi:hypothetical protein